MPRVLQCFSVAHWPSFASVEEGRGSVGGESFTLPAGLRLGPGLDPGPQSCLKPYRFGRGREMASERGCVSYVQGPNLINILEVASGAGEAALRVLTTFAAEPTLACLGYKFNDTFPPFADPPFCSSDSAREPC